jgi:hypothetical protein
MPVGSSLSTERAAVNVDPPQPSPSTDRLFRCVVATARIGLRPPDVLHSRDRAFDGEGVLVVDDPESVGGAP